MRSNPPRTATIDFLPNFFLEPPDGVVIILPGLPVFCGVPGRGVPDILFSLPILGGGGGGADPVVPGAVETGGGGLTVVDVPESGGGTVEDVLLVAIGGIGGGLTELVSSPLVSLASFPKLDVPPVKSVFFILSPSGILVFF